MTTTMPPGLGLADAADPASEAAPAAEDPLEMQMAARLGSNDHDGTLALLKQAPAPNHRMINMGFTATVASGKSVEAASVEMLQACTSAGIVVTPAMHNNVLGHLSKKGPPEATLAWLARMQDSSVPRDRVACNIQLKAHAAMGDLHAAVDLLSLMMRGNVRGPPSPDAISFNTVISALAKKPGYAAKAEKLLTTMLDSGFDADTRSFTGVIVGFARASRPDAAAKWLERMLQAKVQPDTATFNAVLLAHANAGDCDGAFAVLRSFEERVLDECPNAKLDEMSFNTLISACAKAGKPQRAEEAFFKMETMGLTPSHVTFSAVLTAHARAGNPSQAQAWLEAMISRGSTPDAVSYNSVCAAHAKVGDAAAAMACFRNMSDAGVQASAVTRAIMVNALVQAGDADGAESMLQSLVQQREPLDASSFNPLLSLHAKAGRPERALALLKLMESAHVQPSLVTFNSLAAAYAMSGDQTATEEALQQAKDLGYVLDRYSYGALLQVALKAMSKQQNSGGRPPSNAPGAAGRELALKYVEQLCRAGIPINDYLQTMASRAVGDRTFAELRKNDRSGGRRGRSAGGGASAKWSASKGEGTTSGSTMQGRRLSSEQGGAAARAAKLSTAKSPIKKADRAPPPKAPTRAISPKTERASFEPSLATTAAAAPTDVRLLAGGLPLTRSKSERARLLALAQDVMSAPTGSGGSSGNIEQLGVEALATGVPLTRSAASELAITMSEDMRL